MKKNALKGEGFGVMLVRVVMKVGKQRREMGEGEEIRHGRFLK
jgi:hypothetical protein